VTVASDNGYVVAAMFPAAMPTTVMKTVLCARASVLAIVATIVTAIAVSIVANVNAKSLGAHNARGGHSENGRTNESKFLHSYLQLKGTALTKRHRELFRDLLPLFPERMFMWFLEKPLKAAFLSNQQNTSSVQGADQGVGVRLREEVLRRAVVVDR
jgi:hypothetical protein